MKVLEEAEEDCPTLTNLLRSCTITTKPRYVDLKLIVQVVLNQDQSPTFPLYDYMLDIQAPSQ